MVVARSRASVLLAHVARFQNDRYASCFGDRGENEKCISRMRQSCFRPALAARGESQ
jgi:hypothetical protein